MPQRRPSPSLLPLNVYDVPSLPPSNPPFPVACLYVRGSAGVYTHSCKTRQGAERRDLTDRDRRGSVWAGGGLFSLTRTRAAVFFAQWVTSFYANSRGGILGGLPAPDTFTHSATHKQSYGNSRCARATQGQKNLRASSKIESSWWKTGSPLWISLHHCRDRIPCPTEAIGPAFPLTFFRAGQGCYTESGHVVIVLSLRHSERYKVPLAWISGNPLMEHCMCDQFGFSASGFSTEQGASEDSMSVVLVMEALQLHSPCPLQL